MRIPFRKLSFAVFQDNKPVALTIIWLMILGDIIFGGKQSDIVFFGILAAYLIAIVYYRLKSKATFIFCFFLLGVFFIEFIINNTSEHTEKTAVWLFIFMGTGIIQELVLEKK